MIRDWPAEAKREDPHKHARRWAKRPDPDTFHRAATQGANLPGSLAGAPGYGGLSSGAWCEMGDGIIDHPGIHRTGRASSSLYAHDPDQDMTTLYIGTTGGGLWKFDWRTVRWIPISETLEGSPSVGAFLLDPDDPRHIVIGTGDLNRYGGSGMYVSSDGGASWTRSTMNPTPSAVTALKADSSRRGTYLASTNQGTFRSDDHGATWTRVDTNQTTDLQQDPAYPKYWYAGAPGIGVLESFDGGRSFHPISGNGGNGIPNPVGRVSLTVCDAAANYVYALIDDGRGQLGGIYRSDYYGYSWTSIDTMDGISWGQGFHANAIAVDPRDPNVLLVGMGGFQRTTNATASSVSWVRAKQPGHADYTSFQFIPPQLAWSHTWVAITSDGGYCTYDYSTEKFYTDGNLLGLNVAQTLSVPHGLARSSRDPNLLIGGTQDNGVVKIEASARRITYMTGGDGGQCNISPNNTGDFFANVGGPPFSRNMSIDGGASWNGIDCGLPFGDRPSLLHDPIVGSPLLFTQDFGGFLYFAYETDSNCWFRINPSNPVPTGPKAFDVAPNPWDVVFYVAGYDANVYVMDTSVTGRLGSMNWVDRTPNLPSNATRNDSAIHASRFLSEMDTVFYTTAFARPSRAYRSLDRGRRWTDCTGDLKTLVPDAAYWELVSIPGHEHILLLACSVGVFRSDDGGVTWGRYMTGLPAVVDVRDVEISLVEEEIRVRIATNGRGWWERSLRP